MKQKKYERIFENFLANAVRYSNVIAIVLFAISPIFIMLYINNQLLAAALIIVCIALMATFIITAINKHNKKNNYGKSL